jgi:antitoxin component of MazEF toxin-antitoxin module
MRAFRSCVQKITRNGNSNTVVLAPGLMRELDLHAGDHVAVRRVGNGILLVPIEAAIRGRVAEDQTAAAAPVEGTLVP